MNETCRKDKEDKIYKYSKVTNREKIGHSLNVYYTIYRSILNKIDSLKRASYLYRKFRYHCINRNLELSGKVFSPEIRIDGYTMFHVDRERKRCSVV